MNVVYESECKLFIVMVGLSIYNCSVEIREKMAVSLEVWNDVVVEFCVYLYIEEVGILLMCNCMEIYVVVLSYECGLKEVEEWMGKYSGVDVESFREYLFVFKDCEFMGYLLKVLGGLDLVVMGEG